MGLLMECYHRKGVDVPETPGCQSGRNNSENALIAQGIIATEWKEVTRQPHVAVVFLVRGMLCHCGFTLPGNRFIHTWEGSRSVVIERLRDWENRIAGYYDYKSD
jgi:hypothetical protein